MRLRERRHEVELGDGDEAPVEAADDDEHAGEQGELGHGRAPLCRMFVQCLPRLYRSR
jgi:hypothetical protein